MKSTLYMWHYLGEVTDNYHDGGAVIIVTDRNPKDVWREYAEKHNSSEDKWGGDIRVELPEEIDEVYSLQGAHEERVYIYEDSGCC